MNRQIKQVQCINDSFFQLFNKSSDCVLVVNAFGNIIYMNSRAEGLFNINFSEGMELPIKKLIPRYPAGSENKEKLKLVGINDTDGKMLLQIQTQSLVFQDEYYEAILVKDDQDKTEELKTVSKELADIELALDVSTIIATTDSKGTITAVNQKFCELSKYKEEELIGQNHRILNSGYHSKEFFRKMWRTIGSGEIWKGEIQNKAKDGSLYWVDTTIVPFLDEKGKPYKFVSIRTDITKRMSIERELQEAMKIDFSDTMSNLQNGIFKMKKDEDGHFIYTMAEGKLLSEIGASSDNLFGKTPNDVFSKEIAKLKQQHYAKAFAGNRVNYEVELCGKLVYVDVSPIKHGDAVFEIVGSVHDISELRSTQKKLQVNQQQYQSLFEHSQDYVITYHTNAQVFDLNPRAEETFGVSKENIPNLSMKDLIPDQFEKVRESYFKKALEGNLQNFELEIVNYAGKRLFFNVTFMPIILDKQIKGVYSIGKDITEQKTIQEMNAYLAHHDELTKMPNRRWIDQKLRESLIVAEQNNTQVAVLFIDLDRFKYINDSLGHLFGDRLLELISNRILDVMKENQFAARMGGDEFMVVLPEITGHDEVIDLANNLLQNLAAPLYLEDYELFVSASIGISMYPQSGTTAVELMKKADVALYKAKEVGRDMFQIYDHSMDKSNIKSLLLERDLRKAVLNNEFIAYFQPKVDAITGRTIGAEALIRWMHPEIGYISPGEFIPLAEETGLIIPIGKWMKRRVCEQLAAWREAGIPLIPISVNISSTRFLQKRFSEEVRLLLEEYQLDGKWLEFEITENSLMKNEEYILQTLHEFKGMGIKIFIDDFGTGYSSFHYLKTFNLDGIKIDMSFIQNISSQSENAGITAAMIKMAQHLKMDVIAEGVETKEELSFLLEEGCRYVQGFYFGKPCPIGEFETRFMHA
ncbi:EAL domain-containing protein [Bacillus dakarensis]|uniref:EAL domain-containing protein n=1 Tax=Robertmurraya dakarensis TaxID=1926278 RepID=UPI0009820CE3|nr:EAL domain-containing protein [Bacillus dakarensis]